MLLCLVGLSQQYGPVKQLLLQIGAKKGATGKCAHVFLFNLFVCAIFHLLPEYSAAHATCHSATHAAFLTLTD